ncbi:MAG: ABC transporter substrate-binding protein, partial [Chloroflexota bacterium]|nr:ABC transporter substrate-binding protein [Chloroflexota bacterium]
MLLCCIVVRRVFNCPSIKEKLHMQSGKKFKLGILPTFLVVMAMLLAACGGSSGTGTTPTTTKASADKQVFNWPAGVADVGTLDPALDSDVPSTWAIQMIYTGMVSLDDKLNVVPQMASRWDVSSDGMTYTFHLKSGLKFSDGTPITSADVAYSMDRSQQPRLKSPVAYYLGLLKDSDKLQAGKISTIINDSILTPDASTVVLKITQPAA